MLVAGWAELAELEEPWLAGVDDDELLPVVPDVPLAGLAPEDPELELLVDDTVGEGSNASNTGAHQVDITPTARSHPTNFSVFSSSDFNQSSQLAE